MATSRFRHAGLTLAFLSAIPGCQSIGRKGPYVSANTEIVGETVAVSVMAGPADISIGKLTKHSKTEVTFYLPLDEYPAGRHEIPIVATDGNGGRTETSVGFFAPHRTAGKAYFHVVGCGGDGSVLAAGGPPAVRSEAGRTGRCTGSTQVLLRAVTMPGATVTVAETGQTATADAGGEVEIPLSTYALHLAGSTAQNEEKKVVLTHPWGFVTVTSAKDARSIEAKVAFAESSTPFSYAKGSAPPPSFMDDWLKDFKPGQPLAPGLTANPRAKSAVYAGHNGRAYYVGAPGPLRDLTYVATLQDSELRSCLGQVEYRTKVTVYEARTGKKPAERSFDAPASPCRRVVGTVNGKPVTDHYYADDDKIEAFLLAN